MEDKYVGAGLRDTISTEPTKWASIKFTEKEFNKLIEPMLVDYRNPTDGMSEAAMEEFDRIMKETVKNYGR